ncbi:MAG: hypothetical protein NZ480_03800 [Bdellovibrionaceae bacterium]|nr:hypothetical protein [Pseudobdellovibrionaceae bacterium]MDW8190035.1 hypothetical protein [Pseudobdellovibrionaceae bacterium]
MVDVVLIFGGVGEERLVSVASAQNLILNYSFSMLLFWDAYGDLFLEPKEAVLSHRSPFTEPYRPTGKRVLQVDVTDFRWTEFLRERVVFLGLHGGLGENGELQSLFERNKIVFTGSSSRASRLAFDKWSAKAAMKRIAKVPLSQQASLVESPESFEQKVRSFFQQYGACVLKPNCSGSSFGLFFVDEEKYIRDVVSEIYQTIRGSLLDQNQTYLIETKVKGRELTVSYLDGCSFYHAQSLCPSEVILEKGHHFDYLGKYLGRGVREVTPADISIKAEANAKRLAQLAHHTLGCYGYSRTDMILQEDDSVVFLETNTLPGLSTTSFLPQQLRAQGISLNDFIQAQVELALNRPNWSS